VTKKSPLSKEAVEHWPEVFKDIDVQVVPLAYLHSLRVTFVDGKIWDIDIKESKKKGQNVNLEDVLDDMFEEYEDVIVNVDFRLDTEQLKTDIQKRTQRFMKKRK
jgi:hypothetical protein